MKVKYYMLFILAISQLGYTQISNKYNIYLLFNSAKQEMSVTEKKVSDSVKINTFSFSKEIATENYKYVLAIGENGKIKKDKKTIDKHKINNNVVLYHYSYRNKKEYLKELTGFNVINYEDFINSEFKSFNRILKNAEKVYIIDLNRDTTSAGNYLAYEVVF